MRRLAPLALLLAAACGGGASPPAPSALGYATPPASGSAVAPLAAVRVSLLDAGGQVLTGASTPVSLALVDAGGAALGGTLTRAPVAGVATFDDLVVTTAGSGYRLSATAPGVAAVVSPPFDVAAGPPAQLLVLEQPVGGRTATPLGPALAVRLEDAVGNAAAGEVRVGIAEGPPGAALAGTTRVTAAGGLARFPDLSAPVAGTYRLEASSPGVPSVQAAPVVLTDAWRSVGPYGGPVAVAGDLADPGAALAGGGAHVGLWRTRDGGTSWQPVPTLRDRAVRPAYLAPGVAWAVGDSVWRTADGGDTWTESPGLVRLAGGAALRPVVDPVDGAVYLAVNDYEARVLVTTDGGATFAGAPPLPPGVTVLDLAAGPAGLAAITHHGFLALPRGAAAWTAPVPVGLSPTRVLLHPTDAREVLVASVIGLHRSTDGGASWDQLLFENVRDLWRDPAGPDTVLALASEAGVFGTSDGGASFQPRPSPPLHQAISLSGAAGRLWLGADTGPFTSTDGGGAWTRAAAGLVASEVSAVAVSRGAEPFLLAGTSAGEVWRSADDGATWTLVHQGYAVNVLRVDAAAPGRVFLYDAGAGLLRSTDGGRSWQLLAGAPPGTGGLVACRAAPDTLWMHDQNGTGVWRSADGGDTWARVFTAEQGVFVVGAVAADAADPLRAWVAAIDFAPDAVRSGLYRTSDGGATWERTLDGVRVFGLAAGPAGVLWVTGGGGLQRSDDGGAAFADVSSPASVSPLALAADQAGAGRFAFGGSPYAAWEPGDGVWVSDDGGASWFGARSGHDRFATLSLAIDPADPDVLYAGTRGGGLLVTTTGGR